jgi:hypothetical protein
MFDSAKFKAFSSHDYFLIWEQKNENSFSPFAIPPISQLSKRASNGFCENEERGGNGGRL